MTTSRKLFLSSVAVLLCLSLALALHSTVASDLTQFLLMVIVIAACFQASRRAVGYARQFWRLIGASFIIFTLAQTVAVLYNNLFHPPYNTWWPSDILYLFYVAPMAIAFFLGDERPESHVYRWQQWLDFLQIGIVSVSAYIFFLYFPLVLPSPTAASDTFYLEVFFWRALIIAAAYVLRATQTHSKLVKSLFGRVAIFLLIFAVCDTFYIHAELFWKIPFGTWYELFESAPMVLLVWLIATWNPPEEIEPVALKDTSSEALLLAQFSHVALPLLVLVMAARAVGQQLIVAVVAIAASFGCSSLRLFLNQRAQNELLAQQKRSAESLRAAEAQFRGLLESAPDAMVVVNREGRIVLVNAQAVKSFGYAREDFIGQPIEILVPEMLREMHLELRSALLQRPETRPMGASRELFALRKDGSEFPAEICLSLLETSDDMWVSAAIRDLTERRKLENQFRQAQKMESIGTLAGGVAHDFNNLLTIILSYSSSLAEELSKDSRQYRAADQIHQAAERGAALTSQMLAFSRQQVFQLRVVNLNDIISNLLSMLQRIIGEHIVVQTDLAEDLRSVKADPGQLEQVLMNLCVNARDAMPKGGRLTLETRNVVLEEEFVARHIGASLGPHVSLTVSDTGSGMDPATLTRIFEPFFTTKEAGQGTGLGLAMVYGVVKQSGGSIWAHSELSRGTTFEIYLPQVHDVSESQASKARPASLKPGVETILLVEDDPAVRELVCSLLQAQGYTVLAPDHPRDAGSFCAAHPGMIHLLLTDMIMPGVTGQEVARQVGSLRPGIKVIFMSGYTDAVMIQGQGFDHTTAFLQKPFSRASLTVKVREVLDADGFNLPDRTSTH